MSTGIFMPLENQVNAIIEALGQINHGLLANTTELQSLKFLAKMTLDILVNKGIVTTDEINQLYETGVNKPMQAYVEAINKQISNQVEKDKVEIESPILGEQTTEENRDSDNRVILASERFKNKETLH